MQRQATKYGMETLLGEVIGINHEPEHNVVNTTESDFVAECVIIVSGSQFRKLGIPGEDKFDGKSVSYCATCDVPLFRDREMTVVGGDTALSEALHLSKFASSVSVVHRRNQLRAAKILQEKTMAEAKIEFIWDTVVAEIEGNQLVKQIKLKNTKDATIALLPMAGVFIAVDMGPNTRYVRGILPLDEQGCVITNELMETEFPGIFAAGDVQHNSIRQAVAGDGAVAALAVEKFLSSQ